MSTDPYTDGDDLTDYREGQWVVKELDAVAKTETNDQKKSSQHSSPIA